MERNNDIQDKVTKISRQWMKYIYISVFMPRAQQIISGLPILIYYHYYNYYYIFCQKLNIIACRPTPIIPFVCQKRISLYNHSI